MSERGLLLVENALTCLARTEEKEDREKREAVEKKRQEKSLKSAGGVQKERKRKAIRIRKGVKIMGVKIKDAESKKKAIKLMKASAAQKMDEGGSSKPLRGRRGIVLSGGKGTPGLGISKGGVEKAAKAKKLSKAKERRKSLVMMELPSEVKPIDVNVMQA